MEALFYVVDTISWRTYIAFKCYRQSGSVSDERGLRILRLAYLFYWDGVGQYPFSRMREVPMFSCGWLAQWKSSTFDGGNRIAVLQTSQSRQVFRVASIFLFFLVLIAFVGPATSPAHADEEDIPVIGDGEAYSFVVLRATAYCPEPPAHLPAVDFRLELSEFESPPDPIIQEIFESKDVRFDLTVFRGGFKRGDFDSHQLPPFGNRSVPWDQPDTKTLGPSSTVGDLQPGVVHFARALILIKEGWVPTETIKFTTPICPVDGLDREGETP
jgi:hypothetical protein